MQNFQSFDLPARLKDAAGEVRRVKSLVGTAMMAALRCV